MLNYGEIRDEIERLEHGQTNYANVEKLAMLYQVLNNAPAQSERSTPEPNYSYASTPDSDFLSAFKKAPIDDALRIIDNHMEAVRILYPKEYNMVLRKINDLI